MKGESLYIYDREISWRKELLYSLSILFLSNSLVAVSIHHSTRCLPTWIAAGWLISTTHQCLQRLYSRLSLCWAPSFILIVCSEHGRDSLSLSLSKDTVCQSFNVGLALADQSVEAIGYIGRAMSASQTPLWTIGPYIVKSTPATGRAVSIRC